MAINGVLELIAQPTFLAVAEDQVAKAAPDAGLVGVAVAGATSVLGHLVLFNGIGIGDTKRGERIALYRFHRIPFVVGDVVIA